MPRKGHFWCILLGIGEVPERLNGIVSKTMARKGLVGSIPTLSAGCPSSNRGRIRTYLLWNH